MKIALIFVGGFGRDGRFKVTPVYLSLVERLAKRHEVLVIATHQDPEPSDYSLLGVRIVNLGKVSGPPGLRTARKIKKTISILRAAGGDFDVIHAFAVHEPGTLAVACGSLLRTPTVVSLGGGELVWLPQISYGGQGTLRGRLVSSLVVRLARFVSGGSLYALRPLTRSRPDAALIPVGVDSSLMDCPLERSDVPPWRFLHVAGLNKVKDQTTLVRAMRILLDQGLSFQLDCFGVDTLGGRIHDLVRELKLDGIVRLHGFKPLDEVIPFYRSAHLYLQTSMHEQHGAAVLEAAAAGVPTVGTNVGLVAELAPRAAVAIPVRDPVALAQAIAGVLNQPGRRDSLARAAREFAQTYDADWTCTQFEKVYRRLAGEAMTAID